MQIIEHEIKKYSLWRDELSRKKQDVTVSSAAGGGKQVSRDEKGAAKKEYEKTRKKFDGLVRKQDQLLRGMSHASHAGHSSHSIHASHSCHIRLFVCVVQLQLMICSKTCHS